MARAGDLDARVRFESRGLDPNGDPLGDWVERFTIWANVDYQRGSETAVSNRLEGRQPVTIMVRDSASARTITTAFRAVIVSGRGVLVGTELNITAVAPARETGFINILAVAGGAVG